jgi:hypothetical protein
LQTGNLFGGLLATLAIAVSGCAITSDGLELEPIRSGADFAWSSTDGVTGSLTALLPDGRVFRGTYLEVTPATRMDQIEPLLEGWQAHRGWRHWETRSAFAFAKHYAGRIVADLEAGDGQRMRCHLRLQAPAIGMSGGAEGECEISGGAGIVARLAPGHGLKRERA